MTKSPAGRPPFRADHVGSLLRPAALRQAFRRQAAREIGDAEFDRIQDEAIRDVVRLQEEVGLGVVTDGEFRRGSYWGRFVERTDGFEIRGAQFRFRNDQGHEVEFTAPYAKGKIARTQPLALDEFTFLRDVTSLTPKITLPAPSTMHFYRCTDFADRSVYPDPEGFAADLAAVFAQEIADLVAAGCRYIQLDEVAIALLCDPAIRQQVAGAGASPDALVDSYIDWINRAVASVPADVTIGMHMCRGNFKSTWIAEGAYDPAADAVFNKTGVDLFFMEYDTERAGGLEPLRLLPKGKQRVYPGFITTKTAEMESFDDLRRKLDAAASYADINQLGIAPQCGFASTEEGNTISVDDQKRKLELVVRTAEAVWGTA
jgi:methionine synthase II (cobalamin-independent)